MRNRTIVGINRTLCTGPKEICIGHANNESHFIQSPVKHCYCYSVRYLSVPPELGSATSFTSGCWEMTILGTRHAKMCNYIFLHIASQVLWCSPFNTSFTLPLLNRDHFWGYTWRHLPILGGQIGGTNTVYSKWPPQWSRGGSLTTLAAFAYLRWGGGGPFVTLTNANIHTTIVRAPNDHTTDLGVCHQQTWNIWWVAKCPYYRVKRAELCAYPMDTIVLFGCSKKGNMAAFATLVS